MSEWILISGKISRPNKDGIMEIHKAPFKFEPTESELQANRWRMRQVVTEEPEVPKSTIPASIDIRKFNVQQSIAFINGVQNIADLEALLLQEAQNQPKVRRSVVEAIEARRMQIMSPGSEQAAVADIASSERQTD